MMAKKSISSSWAPMIRRLISVRDENQSWQKTKATRKRNPPGRSFLSGNLRVKTNENEPSLFPREAPASPLGEMGVLPVSVFRV